ncbi:MAG: DsbA family protein [Acidobacteria bacterium]|nr:DsbA family protein [Acidobacteriota bacterium]MCW5947894.1 DsbA family protein [Pyrinomonadaceae bacterium]
MADNKEKKGGSPVLIIIVVLVAASALGWWLYNGSSKSGSSGQRVPSPNSQAKPAATIPPNAPPGAQPPNQFGSPTAVVTIEEFADFQCGSCAVAFPILNEIKTMYGSRIHFIYRSFPLPMHDKSYDAAVGAEAAGMQGKFWEMHAQLFQNQKNWQASTNFRPVLEEYASKIGLNVEKFKQDMAELTAKKRVDDDIARAKALSINSTPTIFINGVQVAFTDVNVQGLKAIIDGEFAKQAASQSSNGAAPAAGNAANGQK